MKSSKSTFHALPVVTSALLVLLTGCQDNPPSPTAPVRSAGVVSQQAIVTVESRDPVSSRLSGTPGACLVAVRSPDGGYLSRNTTVQLPSKIASSSSRTGRFAYRGWALGVREPVLLAVCTIPDSKSARAYFENRFSGKPMNAAELRSFAQSAGVVGVEHWGAGTLPYVRHEAEPLYVTDGLASESNATRPAPTDGVTAMILEPCDPTAIIPEPGCDGYVPEEEYVPDTPPVPDGVDFAIIPKPPALPLPSYVVCQGRTDNAHLSTSRGFLIRINVKSSTSCPIPLPMGVNTTLIREQCVFGRLCIPIPQALPGTASSPSATFVQAFSNAECTRPTGWYYGVGLHSVTMWGQLLTSRTVSYPQRIDCSWVQ